MSLFGYVEQTKTNNDQFAKFGLNRKATFVDFKFNPNGGSNGSAKECADFIFKVYDQEFRARFFPLEKIYLGSDLLDIKEALKRDPDTTQKYFNNWQENILNIARCFVTDEQLKKVLVGERVANFANFIKTIEALIKKSGKKPELDVFLEWQKKIANNNDKTYLTFAQSEGRFSEGICVVPHIDKEFKEVKDDNGLKYVAEDGEEHPISRGAYYFRDNNKKAKRQTLNNKATVGSSDFDDPFANEGEDPVDPFSENKGEDLEDDGLPF